MNWFSVILFLAGWLTTLSGVAMGGWLVYRTRRDSYEPLWGGPGKGDSFNVDDGFDQDSDVVGTTLPKSTAAANEAFVNQFADIIAKKGSSNA